jgi:hypothetical protein
MPRPGCFCFHRRFALFGQNKFLAAVTVQAWHDGFVVAQHTVHKSIPVWASTKKRCPF